MWYLPMRDGRAMCGARNPISEYARLEDITDLSYDEKIYVFNRVLEYLALMSTKNIYCQGELMRSVAVGKTK